MRTLIIVAALAAAGAANAQGGAPALDYSYAELRFVDVDENGGDGFILGGSYELQNNWFILGSVTDLGFNGGVDFFTFELGGGYVWNYRPDWDLFANARYMNTDVDFNGGSNDDSGVGLTGGVRGMIAPQFEVRGSVNHVTIGDGDTFIQIAGDYYFTDQFAAGLSFDVGGDLDTLTVGARWYFR